MSDTIPDFDSIHAEFRAKVVRYLKGLVGPDEAEDLCQNVFLKVHAGLENFRGEASVATWIYRIATNAAVDRLRSPSFRQATQAAADSEEHASHERTTLILSHDATEPSVEVSLIRSEMNECIRGFVDALPESYRTVLALSELEGLRDDEIAKNLGLSVGATKIRLHRARRQLKERLEAGCDFYRSEANELACDRKAPGTPPTTR
jgi:RNA polymerase sigma-70 factor (ECF subfamily)